MSDMRSTETRRAEEVDALLLQLDSTLKTLSVTREQISSIPEMVTSVAHAEVIPDLVVRDTMSISEQVSLVISSLIENLWERGTILPSILL
jgi:hypothetical protein